MAASGKDLRECEQLLKQEGFLHTDHATLGRDLKRAREELNQATLSTVTMHRDQMLKNLLALETMVRERGLKHDDYVDDLLGIFNQLAKLLGLNADTRVAVLAVGADAVDPEKMVGYRKFIHETRWISESEFQPLWDLCRKLSQPPTAETTAAIAPPKDSPLWHEQIEVE